MKKAISHTKEESTKVLDQLIEGLVDLDESFRPSISIKLAKIIFNGKLHFLCCDRENDIKL